MHLDTPITLGGLTLPNRIAISPMCQYSAVDGVVQPWHSMHLGSMAISGAGLVIAEATGVLPEGRISPHCPGLWSDAQEAALTRLIAGIRAYSDTPLGIQLGHAGRKAPAEGFDSGRPAPPELGWPTVGPSDIAPQEDWPSPRPLDEEGIARIVEAFAAAARRATRAGMTLIELHGAHGYLLSAFLSPLANRRTDRFGGSLENRMRLPLMVADAVRAALPEGVTMGMRINGTDHAEGGITPDEAGTLAVALREAGLDYVCVSAGGNSRHQQIPPTVPGYQVGLAEEVRRRSGLPTMAVGMILTGRQAEDILAEGRADMVAIGRAALDDPRWPRHALQSLGARPDYPRPYWRSGPDIWRGYAAVHPEAGPG
ncbi:NADH:flavin oxidoreductase/NADH oxidase [Wenxinia marina]|uniref:NADH:flavin oxidoreductase, Old Yellow Enzyme family n=1 Tax=Wenxinia marina DSM 24838 TaxID=1123501 RepID=A0A0D0QGY1_9RHOB|nr:NADH:flavin oxidoreductase/NADH oxidase [Wenxinia marina]KIQ70278.1 NADH:flavin oxidoreductase, Old Yellow Enzyme family [Wenxinia marina DSM 24838]GGL49860.1 oxidoreductase [Wenxinia marina]